MKYYAVTVQILEGCRRYDDSVVDHFVIDLSDYLGYYPPWRNDDIWWEDERKFILRSDIHTDDEMKSMKDIIALMEKWGLKGKVELEDGEE